MNSAYYSKIFSHVDEHVFLVKMVELMVFSQQNGQFNQIISSKCSAFYTIEYFTSCFLLISLVLNKKIIMERKRKQKSRKRQREQNGTINKHFSSFE